MGKQKGLHGKADIAPCKCHTSQEALCKPNISLCKLGVYMGRGSNHHLDPSNPPQDPPVNLDSANRKAHHLFLLLNAVGKQLGSQSMWRILFIKNDTGT